MLVSRWTCILFTGIALSLLSGGCANYAKDRALDFADSFAIGGGLGAGANLRATQYLQGGVLGNSAGFRFVGREVYSHTGVGGGMGIAPLFYYRSGSVPGANQSRLHTIGKTLIDTDIRKNWYSWYDAGAWKFVPERAKFQERFDRRLYDIGASLYIGIGLDFDFNIVEFGDFFLGFFGVDFLHDDGKEERVYQPTQEEMDKVDAEDQEVSSQSAVD